MSRIVCLVQCLKAKGRHYSLSDPGTMKKLTELSIVRVQELEKQWSLWKVLSAWSRREMLIFKSVREYLGNNSVPKTCWWCQEFKEAPASQSNVNRPMVDHQTWLCPIAQCAASCMLCSNGSAWATPNATAKTHCHNTCQPCTVLATVRLKIRPQSTTIPARRAKPGRGSFASSPFRRKCSFTESKCSPLETIFLGVFAETTQYYLPSLRRSR